MTIAGNLAATLAGLDIVTRHCRDEYWIISSAAVALHIGRDVDAADVDLLISAADGEILMRQFGLINQANGRHALFRSALLLRYDGLALPVEIMADLSVRGKRGWRRILPKSRERIVVDGGAFFVPDRNELSEMLALFGRPKDLARLRLLADSPAA